MWRNLGMDFDLGEACSAEGHAAVYLGEGSAACAFPTKNNDQNSWVKSVVGEVDPSMTSDKAVVVSDEPYKAFLVIRPPAKSEAFFTSIEMVPRAYAAHCVGYSAFACRATESAPPELWESLQQQLNNLGFRLKSNAERSVPFSDPTILGGLKYAEDQFYLGNFRTCQNARVHFQFGTAFPATLLQVVLVPVYEVSDTATRGPVETNLAAVWRASADSKVRDIEKFRCVKTVCVNISWTSAKDVLAPKQKVAEKTCSRMTSGKRGKK